MENQVAVGLRCVAGFAPVEITAGNKLIGACEAVDLAGQTTFCCRIILFAMGFFNLGAFIQLISFPVMR